MSLNTRPLIHRINVAERSGAGAIPQVGDLRSRWFLPSLSAASALIFAGLLYITSYKNFFYDEWDFVSLYRPSQSTSILLPHNEHWTTIPILIWKALLVLFGLRSHLPYQAVAIAAHVACVLLLFQLIKRRSGEMPAFAAALVLLVLGTGAKNIVLAFQLTWTLSIAFGLLAMLVIDTSRPQRTLWPIATLSGLLLCSLMSTGLGLGFVVAAAVQLLLDRSRRYLLLALPAPLVFYLAWFLAYGASGSACEGCPTPVAAIRSIDPKYLLDVASFVWLGLTASVLALLGLTVFGMPLLVVQAILVGFIGLFAWHLFKQRGFESWEIGLLAGLVVQFTLIALARVPFGLLGAADSHYVYVGAIYLLPLAANGLKRIQWRPILRPAFVVAVAVIVISNGAILLDQALAQRGLMQTENAELRVVELFRGAPDIALNSTLDDEIMPQLTAARYYSAIDELGSPVATSTPAVLDRLPANAVDRQLVKSFGAAVTVTANTQRSAATPCHRVNSLASSTLDAEVPDGGSLMLQSSSGSDAVLSLGLLGPPTSKPMLQIRLDRGTPEWVQVPNTGRSVAWRLRIRATPVGELLVCGVDRVQFHSGTSIFSASAAGGTLDTGWLSVRDAAAYGGLAAELPGGTARRSRNTFGAPMLVPDGTYDVWYRARVDDVSEASREMTLGVFDLTTQRWMGSTTYRAYGIGRSYVWVRAVSSMIQSPGHRLVFMTESNSRAGANWFIDEAVILPAGAPAPSDGTPIA